MQAAAVYTDCKGMMSSALYDYIGCCRCAIVASTQTTSRYEAYVTATLFYALHYANRAGRRCLRR
jgi:hypothetical protein